MEDRLVIEARPDSRRHHRSEHRRVRTEDAGAAEGTVGVGTKPGVDTIEVEGVGAKGECSDVLVVFEF